MTDVVADWSTRTALAAELSALGLGAGDVVMVHAGLRAVGPVMGGADAVPAPLDTCTLMHHAEHLARLPGKRVIRTEVPFATPDGVAWRWVEEFDTGSPVVDALPTNFIERIMEAYLATGRGRRGRVETAPSVLVDAAEVLAFGVAWIEGEVGR